MLHFDFDDHKMFGHNNVVDMDDQGRTRCTQKQSTEVGKSFVLAFRSIITFNTLKCHPKISSFKMKLTKIRI